MTMPLPVLKCLDARIPEWNFDALSERVCPFCGNGNAPVLVRPDQLPVAFCDTCGCWYVANAPHESELSRIYDSYFSTHRPMALSAHLGISMIENALKASQSDWQLQILSRTLGGLNNKYIVDVGCGVGRFLVMAKAQGADVVGCDLSPEACEFARNHLGIVVHCKTLQECAPSIGRVDAVTMRDLIEHPLEPMTTMETAYEMLKPGGCLLIHTPNGGGAGRSLGSALEWVGFRVDLEHLHYLSPQTINWLSQKLNMRIERLEAFGFPGLKGIEKLPSFANKSSKAVHLLKRIAGELPGMRKTARILRTIKNEITDHNPRELRLGSYHLFSILRKA